MFRTILLVVLGQILCFQGYTQQVNVAQYLDASIFDGINPFDYNKIKFSWNMAGNVQIEMNEGLYAIDQNQLGEAIGHFNQVLKLDSDFGPAYYYRSICHKKQLNLNSAEYDMKQASRLLKISECFIELGDIYYLKREFGKAIEAYEKALKVNPKLVTAHYKLGCLMSNLSQIDMGIKFFEKCLELDSTYVKANLQLGLISMRFEKDKQRASQLFTKVIHTDSSNVQAYFWRSLVYLGNREDSSSLADLNRIIELAPSNPYFLLIRGLLLVELKKFDYAFIDLRKALTTNKVSEGRSRFNQNPLDKRIDMQNASEYLNRVLYGYDDLSTEFLKIGFCLLLAGKYAEAIENFDRVYRLNKSACEVYLTALAYEHMGEHTLAFKAYSNAILLDPDIFDTYKKRAVYRSELKEWDGAFDDLNEMRRLQPGSYVTNRLSGFLKHNYADYNGSIKELDIYLKQDSADVEALKVRADSKSKLKDFLGAASDFKRAVALTYQEKELERLVITNTLLAGDTINAIKLLIEFNKTNPMLGSEIQLTVLYIQTRDFKMAEARISKLDKEFGNTGLAPYPNTNMSYVYYLKSRLHLKQGHNTDALKQINKCLKLSDLNEFLFQRAMVFLQMNQIENARKDLDALKKKGFKEAEQAYSEYGL